MIALISDAATLHVVDNPFRPSTRRTCAVRPGVSLAQTISENWPATWSEDEIPRLAVAVNGRVERDLWREIEPGDVVSVMPEHAEAFTAIGASVAAYLGATGTAATIVAAAVNITLAAAISFGVNQLLAPTPPSLRTGENSGSSVYRWDGVLTDYSAVGAPRPVVYGEHLVGGSVIAFFIRSRRNRTGAVKGELWMQLLLSEGEIESIGGVDRDLDNATGNSIPWDMWINGTRAREIPGLRVSTRLGRLNQNAVAGMNDLVRRVDGVQSLRKGDAPRRFTTRNPVDRVELGIRFPKGLTKIDSATGDLLWSDPIRFQYRFKRKGAPDSEYSDWHRFHIRHRAAGNFTKFIPVDELPGRDDYDFELERLTARTVGQATPSVSELEARNEIQDRSFRLPGLATLTLIITANEVVNGPRPSVEVLLRGRKVRVWDGVSTTNPAFEKRWTRDPYWITHDILTNTDYSFGDDLRNAVFDLDDWKAGETQAAGLVDAGLSVTLAASAATGDTYIEIGNTTGWAEGDTAFIDKGGAGEQQLKVIEITDDGRLRVDTSLTANHASGTAVAKFHPRFEFDGVFDSQRSPWEQANSVLATARSQLVKVGNLIMLHRSVPKTPVLLLTEGNMERDSIEVTRLMPRNNQPNRLNIQMYDRTKRFAMHPIPVNADDAVLDQGDISNYYQREAYRPADEAAWGITRAEQATRHGGFRLRQLRLPKWEVKGVTTLQALQAGLGSVIDVAHPTILPVKSGLVIEAALSGTSTIKIDRDVVLAAATTYGIKLRVGDSTWVERTITTAAGSYASGTALAISGTWPDDVDKHAPFSLGPQTQIVLPFELTSFEELEDNRIRFEGLEYVAAIHVD